MAEGALINAFKIIDVSRIQKVNLSIQRTGDLLILNAQHGDKAKDILIDRRTTYDDFRFRQIWILVDLYSHHIPPFMFYYRLRWQGDQPYGDNRRKPATHLPIFDTKAL